MTPGVKKVTEGYYTLQEGDTPSSVARKLYGDVHMAPALLEANGQDWEAGGVITVPGFTGVLVYAREGEQFPSLHRKAFNNPAASAAAMVEFFKWNGHRLFEEGDWAFFIDLRRKSYGY